MSAPRAADLPGKSQIQFEGAPWTAWGPPDGGLRWFSDGKGSATDRFMDAVLHSGEAQVLRVGDGSGSPTTN